MFQRKHLTFLFFLTDRFVFGKQLLHDELWHWIHEHKGAFSLSESPSGLLATICNATLQVRSAETEYSAPLASIRIVETASELAHLMWSPNSSLLACSASSGRITVFSDTLVQRCTFSFNPLHASMDNAAVGESIMHAVCGMFFHPVHPWIVTLTFDGSLRITTIPSKSDTPAVTIATLDIKPHFSALSICTFSSIHNVAIIGGLGLNQQPNFQLYRVSSEAPFFSPVALPPPSTPFLSPFCEFALSPDESRFFFVFNLVLRMWLFLITEQYLSIVKAISFFSACQHCVSLHHGPPLKPLPVWETSIGPTPPSLHAHPPPPPPPTWTALPCGVPTSCMWRGGLQPPLR